MSTTPQPGWGPPPAGGPQSQPGSVARASSWLAERQFAAQARVFGIKIKDGVVSHGRNSGPVAGAHATVESVGEVQKRLLRKNKDERQVFLTITGPDDSYTILVELKGDPKHQASARQFAARFNSLASSSS
jgi:hypothetical protein